MKIIPQRFMQSNYNLKNVQTESLNLFKQIMFKTKNYIDSWHGELLFVYIPRWVKTF